MAICDKDCFNCPHPDCINDAFDPEDRKAHKRIDALLRDQTPRQKKIAAYNAAYYAEHKDEIAAYNAAYYAEHKDEIAARSAAYYAEHKDEIADRKAAYYAKPKDATAVNLPKEEYTQVQENGRMVTYTTMRQKALHVIGLDYKRPYTRHGKKFYRPYRNSWGGRDADLDKLVEVGLMNAYPSERTGERYWYSFNRAGLDWLGEQIGVKIWDAK